MAANYEPVQSEKCWAATIPNVICPKIVKKLERNKLEEKNYIFRWSNQM